MRHVIASQRASWAWCAALSVLFAGACSGGGGATPSGDGGDGGGTTASPDASSDASTDGGADGGTGDGGAGDGGTGDSGGTNGGNNVGPRPDCGNAELDDDEECDDGNVQSGDGCSEACQLEAGFSCPVLGAGCEECGNGNVESSEECDDGNREDGDGCSATCDLEEGAWACPVPGEACELCGDGTRDDNERCDDGNTASGDGCSDLCRSVDDGYACPVAGTLCSLCGNSDVEAGEECDDGNRSSGDGCVANCRAVEPGWACPEAGGSCTLCGDGVLDDGEQCDDGNFRAEDGCTGCRLDAGAVCPVEGATCSVCGNGVIEPTAVDDVMTALEECDDGNAVDDDGCSSECLQDPGYACVQPGVSCSQCGDGVVSGFESCDDGRQCVGGTDAGDVCMIDGDCDGGSCEAVGADGCSASCQTEDHFTCPSDGGPCVECGNGVREEGEACDDGRHCSNDPATACSSDADCGGATCAPLSGDGCTRRCSAVEGGATCVEDSDGFTQCAFCGNGSVEILHDSDGTTELLAEACDDGNTLDGDGCNGSCTGVDEGYNCFFAGFPCAECGDGKLQPGEKCDEGTASTAGCDDQCQTVEPWVCPVAGTACALCGDGQLDPVAEACDDGNLANGDGCDAACDVESGYVCDGEGRCTSASCGDGFAAGDEECDDGNNVSGDGCNFVCDVEDGWACNRATGCRRTVCGDGVTEGSEECDDGSVCSGGSEDGASCTASDDACVTGGGTCAPAPGDGCDDSCMLEIGFECPPGQPCVPTTCGDAEVRGAEECDDGGLCSAGSDNPGSVCNHDDDCSGGTCEAQAADGCDTSCQLEPGYHCPTPGAPCEETACGDGLVQGLEACDDGATCVGGDNEGQDCSESFALCDAGGGSCEPEAGDGCDATCEVEKLYRCTGEPSECRPIIEFVAVRKFNVENVSPDGLSYDPERRSFAGHKAAASKVPVELCLDGTMLNQDDTTAGANGTVYLPDDTLEELPASYVPPPRPGVNQLSGATYDPFTGHILYLAGGVLTELPPGYTGALGDIQEALPGGIGTPEGLTVGEDGDLYVTDNSASEAVFVIARDVRICIGGSNASAACDVGADCDSGVCSAQDPGTGSRNTSFDMASTVASWSASTTNNLAAIFTVPGEGLLGTFATPSTGALSQCVGGDNDGADCTGAPGICTGGGSCQALPQFSFWDSKQLPGDPLFERSTLPGLLFSFGDITDESLPYASNGEAAAAEAAADGGAFIICSRNSSAPCLLFARGCRSDDECHAVVPGTTCNLDVPAGGVPYCAAEGRALDDRARVGAGSSDVAIDVLANDSRSESACIDPNLKVVALTGGDGVTVDDRFCSGGTSAGANCVGEPFLCEGGSCDSTGVSVTTERGGTVTITNDGADVSYDAPSDGEVTCGFIDTFQYTADLGGGVLGTATVRVLVACVCGDSLVQPGEQCDCGDGSGELPGSCTEPNGELPARCSTECLLNVVCGDAIIDPGEACDDGRHCSDDPNLGCVTDDECGGSCVPTSGDGCSSACTLESVCGNGIEEGVEECDDGNTTSGDGCNANCTVPLCGDGVTDPDNPVLAEQCDDGLNNGPLPATCSDTCQINTACGNGIVEGFEECDDGNLVPGDGCSGSCSVEGSCGNGSVDTGLGEECDASAGGTQCGGIVDCTERCLCENYCGDGRIGGLEDCDDGNTINEDGCSESCADEFCGDGTHQASLGEECDDGNNDPSDTCTNGCKLVTACGNSIIDADEQCDDGNTMSGDGCSSTCEIEETVCGDGALDYDEQCDDGNTADGDGCSAECRTEGGVCGNGELELGEECDDGNTTSGDGCSSSCLTEEVIVI